MLEKRVLAIRNAVREEIDSPGRLLGYRAMNLKLRTISLTFWKTRKFILREMGCNRAFAKVNP